MTEKTPPQAIAAAAVPARKKASLYPAPLAARVEKRVKKPLGDFFGLENFGVNLTALAPGGSSALMHSHTKQDEIIYILEGHPTLITESGEIVLEPGMCAGFPKHGEAHHLLNRTEEEVVMLEIGDRSAGDKVSYPKDDLQAVMGDEGRWRFFRKNGTPY